MFIACWRIEADNDWAVNDIPDHFSSMGCGFDASFMSYLLSAISNIL